MMRFLIGAGLVAMLCTTTGQGAAAYPAANAIHAKHAATVQVVVHPVTATGHPSSGYTVERGQGTIQCNFRDPSAGARSKNVETCSPSYEYAVACWKAAAAHHALCLRDPQSKKLTKLKTTGKFARTKIASKKDRAPLSMVLTSGTVCSIRDGGAWSSLKHHPKWYGTYSCTHEGAAWSAHNAAHWGVDESHASWTVHVAPINGHGKLVMRHIKRAYFVATA
jgi:hypothetical protein